jgi:hypothetical protein
MGAIIPRFICGTLVYQRGMTPSARRRAGLALLALAGCTAPAPPRAPAIPEAPRALWELAPGGTSAGMVVRDGAIVRAFDLLAGFGSVPEAGGSQLDARRRALGPIASADRWMDAGLDPALGAAAFVWPTQNRGALVVLPVRDRGVFRAAFHLRGGYRGGREVEELGNGYVCLPAAGRYLCALSIDDIDGAVAPHESGLARAEARLGADDHGDVEVYGSHLMREVDRLREAMRPLGVVSGVTASVRFRHDGASARIHVLGDTTSPRALGFAGAPPPADFAPSAAASPSVARIHVDLAAALPPGSSPQLDPRLRSELVDQLTGDVEVATSGSGVAGASVVAPLKDAARVERYVKERCAETGGSERRYALGRITVTEHGCSGALIPSMLLLPLKVSSVEMAATVEGNHLVILFGEAHRPTPRERDWASIVDGAAAPQALGGAEALVVFTRNPTLGPDVAPARAFKALWPLLDERQMTLVDAEGEVAARIYQAFATAHVGADGIVIALDVTTFAADPPETRAAYEAALAKRTAGDEAGYRAALASVEERFPGTLAARRAAEVREGAPYLGAVTALMMALGRLAPKK